MIYCFDLSFSWKSYHFVDLFPQKRKTFPRRILCILVWSSISGSAKNSTSNDTRHTWAYLKLIYNNGPILWGLSPDLELWFAGYGPATMSSRSYSIFSYFIYYFKKKERKLLINEINEIRCRWIFELKCYVVQFQFIIFVYAKILKNNFVVQIIKLSCKIKNWFLEFHQVEKNSFHPVELNWIVSSKL